MYSDFIATTDRRHCEIRTTEIHKLSILDNDENKMIYVNEIMFHIHLLETKYKSLTSDFLFSVFVRLTSGSYSKSLAMFAIRFVYCLIVIRTLYNSSHLSNRYLHYLMTTLIKNMYGTDLASSKLWLATFLLRGRLL